MNSLEKWFGDSKSWFCIQIPIFGFNYSVFRSSFFIDFISNLLNQSILLQLDLFVCLFNLVDQYKLYVYSINWYEFNNSIIEFLYGVMVEKAVLLWEQNTSLRNYSSHSWCSHRYIMRMPLNQAISVEIQMTRPSQIHLFTRSLRNHYEPSNAGIHSIVNNNLVCVHCCNS